MIRGWLLLPLAALAGCNGGGPSVSINAKSDGEGGNASIATDAEGRVAIKADGFEGTLKLPKVDIKADDFDVNGLKLYPKSKIKNLDVSGEDRMGERDSGRMRLRFEAPAALGEVRQWFAKSLAERNFSVAPMGQGFAGKTSEGEDFALELTAAGNAATEGTITIGK